MEIERGKLMGIAIRAMLEMQADCIRLFRDLDKSLGDLRPLLENLVTTNLGSSINAKQLFVAEYLFRLYAPVGQDYRVLGLNACFHNHPKRQFPEPIFLAANVQYDPAKPDRPEQLQRAWDPWSAYFDWSTDRSFGKALEVAPRRGTIEKIVVAAAPLYSIISIESAMKIINLVGLP